MKPLEMIKKFSNPKMLMLTDQVLVSGASFATNILLARSLGLSEYGKFFRHHSAADVHSIHATSFHLGIFQVMFPVLIKGQDPLLGKPDFLRGFFLTNAIHHSIDSKSGSPRSLLPAISR